MKEIKDNVGTFLENVKSGKATSQYIKECIAELEKTKELRGVYDDVLAECVVYRINDSRVLKNTLTLSEVCNLESLCKTIEEMHQNILETQDEKQKEIITDELKAVLEKAVKAGVIKCENGVYDKHKQTWGWLAVFADELNKNGITSTKYAEIERAFYLENGVLTKKMVIAEVQKNYEDIRNEVLNLIG